MDSTHVIAIFGPLMPFFVSACKMLWPKKDPRYFAIGYSLVVALTMGTSFLIFGEDKLAELLATVGTVAGFIFGIGTGLYKLQK